MFAAENIVPIPLTPIPFSLEMEKSTTKVEFPGASYSSLFPNIQPVSFLIYAR